MSYEEILCFAFGVLCRVDIDFAKIGVKDIDSDLAMAILSRVAPIDKLSVVITICLSFLLLKEPVNARTVVGALLITGGSIVMLMK